MPGIFINEFINLEELLLMCSNSCLIDIDFQCCTQGKTVNEITIAANKFDSNITGL